MNLSLRIKRSGYYDTSLIRFIRFDKTCQRYLYAAICITVLSWIWFKVFYPYPCLVFDSYSYIRAALEHANVNTWPIGYSKFLEGFRYGSHSHYWLVTIQYAFLQVALLLLFLSALYIFQLSRRYANILFALLFLNPVYLFISNFVLSDTLFLTLSLLWITQLLWLVAAPRYWMIITQAVLLTLSLTVRYNALYYPIVAIAALIICRRKIGFKVIGIGIMSLMVYSFVAYTEAKVEAITGEKQFSAFGGWKMANDALYIYSNVPSSDLKPVPDKFKTLDNGVRAYFRSTIDPSESANDYSSGSFYIFNPRSPLVQYLTNGKPENLTIPLWLKAGKYFGEYGIFLKTCYPTKTLRYFIMPNIANYFLPSGEIFGSAAPYYAQDLYAINKFFGLINITPAQSSVQASEIAFSKYPIFHTIIHILFIGSLLAFVITTGLSKISVSLKKPVTLLLILSIIDLLFSILAARIVVRYQLFGIIIEQVLMLYCISNIRQKRQFKP